MFSIINLLKKLTLLEVMQPFSTDYLPGKFDYKFLESFKQKFKLSFLTIYFLNC